LLVYNLIYMHVRNIIISVIICVVAVGAIYYYSLREKTTDVLQTEEVLLSETPLSSGEALSNIKQAVNLKHMVTLQTNHGEIVFETFDADAPTASKNFTDLARKGFYNGTIFHRVIAGFMIQGGDPTGTGSGGPGYVFDDELNPETESYKRGYKKGVVAMANRGPNTNGSQFFIMLEDYPLPPSYTIFGKVVKGQDVVDKIGALDTGDADRPLEEVKIISVMVDEK